MDEATFQAHAATLGVVLGDAQVERLWVLAERLVRWNRAVRLVGDARWETLIRLHLLDSLAASRQLRPEPGERVLDMGTGGGLPALPLAILYPEVEIWAVDSDRRKCAFVKTTAAALGLPRVKAVAARLEGRPDAEGLPGVEWVVSRAYRPLPHFLEAAWSYARRGGQAVALVGPAVLGPDGGKNRQGGVPAGEASTVPGWQLEAVDRYRLPGGDEQRGLLRYRRVSRETPP
ncbi:MAG: 16S rRNA (guanine(527)-N(7))-methyltransferase RsmG [Deltaproteobacteria bacterium]|nr:MAG: 16S rRNA (guanine(527)-N(7))-methyltransferase RsmG [Deltaproteobacteria bacterium]